ncbi:hypothetical protein, partial [Stutzerimonas stutzeri]|uniref:hypothetical protein n=1 Tax=Stutzerimonas stutzeri TaxID=316 RepID=UPI001C614962
KTLISIMEFNLWERMPAVSRGAGEGGPVLAAQWIASNSLANPGAGARPSFLPMLAPFAVCRI